MLVCMVVVMWLLFGSRWWWDERVLRRFVVAERVFNACQDSVYACFGSGFGRARWVSMFG